MTDGDVEEVKPSRPVRTKGSFDMCVIEAGPKRLVDPSEANIQAAPAPPPPSPLPPLKQRPHGRASINHRRGHFPRHVLTSRGVLGSLGNSHYRTRLNRLTCGRCPLRADRLVMSWSGRSDFVQGLF